MRNFNHLVSTLENVFEKQQQKRNIHQFTACFRIIWMV